jgi:peptide/nickel transport system permease protein
MVRFLARRLAAALATLCVGAVASFVIVHLIPGDIAAVIAGPSASHAQVAALRHDLGLDRGLVSQFVTYVGKLAHLDLGRSFVSNTPVTDLLRERVPVTLELIATSMFVAVITALVLSLGAARPGSWLDRIAALWSVLWLAVPVFWVGLLFGLLFGVRLGWLPTGGYVSFFDDPRAALRFSLLPSLTLGFYMSAMLTQFLSSSLRGVMREDFIRTARSTGLAERDVVLRHAARPALLPFTTVAGLLAGTAVGGTVIVEAVFDYPGFGRLFVESILKRDYYVIQAGILLVVAAVMIVNVVVDVFYAFLDPRIRYGGADG